MAVNGSAVIINTVMRYCALCLVVVLLCVSGCTKKEKVVIRLNDIQITEREFLAAYQASPYYGQGNDSLEAFINQYISKKMILNEAERLGLDKGPQFLADLQSYWEQELLKLTLSKANSELPAVDVSDQEVEAFFARQQQALFPDKQLADVKSTIKDYLVKERRKEQLQQWLSHITKQARVEVDYTAIGAAIAK